MSDTLLKRQKAFPPPPRRASAARDGQRLTGFDLFRGLAAFAVISMHAGLVSSAGVTAGAGRLDAVCGFAVPFFLLASFYFNARSLRADLPVGPGIRKRGGRLLVPYAVWTIVYVGLKVVKLLLLHQRSHIAALFADPVGVFLLGGSGVQLYFLPLLFVGLIVQTCLAPGVRRTPTTALWIVFVAAVAVNVWMTASGNAFNMATNRAFEHAIHTDVLGAASSAARFALAALADALRCFPLILLAFLLLRHLPPTAGRGGVAACALLGGAVLLMPLQHGLSVPTGLADETSSLGAFLLAWSLSFVIPRSGLVARVGAYSFGVYLCHQVFLELLQLALHRHGALRHAQGLGFTLGVSAAVFAASWLAVAVAGRCGPALGRAFGLEAPKPQAVA